MSGVYRAYVLRNLDAKFYIGLTAHVDRSFNNITPEDRSGQGHAVHGLAYGKAKNFPSVTRENSKTVLSDKKVDMASIALLVFHGL